VLEPCSTRLWPLPPLPPLLACSGSATLTIKLITSFKVSLTKSAQKMEITWLNDSHVAVFIAWMFEFTAYKISTATVKTENNIQAESGSVTRLSLSAEYPASSYCSRSLCEASPPGSSKVSPATTSPPSGKTLAAERGIGEDRGNGGATAADPSRISAGGSSLHRTSTYGPEAAAGLPTRRCRAAPVRPLSSTASRDSKRINCCRWCCG